MENAGEGGVERTEKRDGETEVELEKIEAREASGDVMEKAVSDVVPQELEEETEGGCSEKVPQPEGRENEEEDTEERGNGEAEEESEQREQANVNSEVVEKDPQKQDRQDKEEEEEEEGSGSSSDGTSEEGEGETEDASGSAAGSSRWSSREEMKKRLRELHKRRLDARQLNHREVVEEDRKNKLPSNWEARQRKIEWEEEDEKARQEAEAAGEDYERQKMLQTSASDLERLQRKRKKKNPDPGFSDYAQAQFRQYDRLTKQLKPDMESYEKQKMEMGADFYPGVNSLVHGGSGKVPKAGIDRMTDDLEKQIEKRSKYSRRRPVNHEGDVDYINERNMRFNKKAARYYDKYTAEIKQNLERGTAV